MNSNDYQLPIEQIKVTDKQISLMKHAIGMDYKTPKAGKYKAYRNYFYVRYDKNWETLKDNGLANKKEKYYEVSDKGISFLEKLYNIKITVEEE